MTSSGAILIGIAAGIVPFLACAYLKPKFGYDDAKDLGVGVTDVHTRFIEEVGDVKDGIRRTLQRLPADRLWIYPDCGLKTRTTEESEAKLKVMVDAVRDIKRELGLD